MIQNTYLYECSMFQELMQQIQAHNVEVEIIDYSVEQKIDALMNVMFPMGFSSIDWRIHNMHRIVDREYPCQIFSALKDLFKKSLEHTYVYVIWDDSYPAIKISLKWAVMHMNDICISSKMWLFNYEEGFVIEWIACSWRIVGKASYEKIESAKTLQNFLYEIPDDIGFHSPEGIAGYCRNRFGFGQNIVAWNLIETKESISIDKADFIIDIVARMLATSIAHDKVYILWDNPKIPTLSASIESTVSYINNLLLLDSPLRIFDDPARYIIEVHDNTITIGLKPNRGTSNKRNWKALISKSTLTTKP